MIEIIKIWVSSLYLIDCLSIILLSLTGIFLLWAEAFKYGDIEEGRQITLFAFIGSFMFSIPALFAITWINNLIN